MDKNVEYIPSIHHNSKENEQSLTMMTFNVGLLRVEILGIMYVFSNPPYSEQRMLHIPSSLISNPVDILAIQECYDEDHYELLCYSLKELYPHNARVTSGDMLKFHNGLVLFSKFPIIKSVLMPYDRVSSLERFMATKSSLIVDVEVPHLGLVSFVNMHTTSGGTADPHHPDSDLDREDEFRQVSEVCVQAVAEGKLPIILGDLNCGPDLSDGNFNYILNKGFRDTFIEGEARGTVVPGSRYTWEPDNHLNTVGPHSHTPPQRMDHILLPERGMEDWVVEKVEVLFRDKVVDVGIAAPVTLSDHYGLLVKVCKKQSSKHAGQPGVRKSAVSVAGLSDAGISEAGFTNTEGSVSTDDSSCIVC